MAGGAGVILGLLVMAGMGHAQSTADRIILGSCSYTDLTNMRDARYAASVGVMSTDRDARARLFARSPEPKGSDICAFVISESFCNESYLDFTIATLTSTMTGGGPGSRFFTALGVGEAMEDPSAPSLGTTLGLGGAVVGGLLGSGDGLGGAVGWGALLGGAGFAIGSIADHGRILGQCNTLQADFSDLTRRMMRAGLTAQPDERQLVSEIRRITARMPRADAELAEVMIDAMAVSAANVEAIR